MSLEKQLEFPFLSGLRMLLYVDKQRKEMKDFYSLMYRFDGDHGKEMTFRDFVADIWVHKGYADRFYRNNHREFFYDDPDEPQYEGKKWGYKPL